MTRSLAIAAIGTGFLMSALFGLGQPAMAQDDKGYLEDMESRLRSLESAAAPAPQGPSRWNQSGTIVHLVAKGASRKFQIEKPDSALTAAGVKQGAVLFDGKKEGARYLGTAYAFAAKCKPQAFAVIGDISADEKQVTLRGKRPALDKKCNVTAYSDESLVLTFISPEGK